MTPAASGGRRPRVLLASGPVGALSPLQASVALARGFVDGDAFGSYRTNAFSRFLHLTLAP